MINLSKNSNKAKEVRFFISHSSEDAKFMEEFTELMQWISDNSNCSLFNTYSDSDGIVAGEVLSNAIRNAIHSSDIVLAIITKSYLRSVVCVSEISASWYDNKITVPIIFEQEGIEFLKQVFGQTILYIDATDTTNPLNCEKCARVLLKAFKTHLNLKCDNDRILNRIKSLFKNCDNSYTQRPFIGGKKVYDDILKYCDNYGVSQLRDDVIPRDIKIENLKTKNSIYILSTTGNSLIKSLSDFITEALQKGTDITVLVPNKMSDFCVDVAEIEAPNGKNDNLNRITGEFNDVLSILKTIRQNSKNNNGHLYFACSYSLLRQTICMGVDLNHEAWGWMSLTLPPGKTVSGTKTPLLVFSGHTQGEMLASLVYEHIIRIINLSKKRGSFIEITDNLTNFDSFYLEKESAMLYWKNLHNTAVNNMIRRKDYKNHLIEVAAQHPLLDDGSPGKEFQERLDYAIDLYNKLKTNKKVSVKIYVPGSLHSYKGKCDPIPLSESGCRYLLDKGIPKDDLFGVEMNNLYKGNNGVYNSADECFVSSKIYLSGQYKQLHSVCSVNQMMRKKLFYIAFGIIPKMHTVDTDDMFHDDIYEIIQTIPDVIYNDHTWQDDNSKNAIRTRKDRKLF